MTTANLNKEDGSEPSIGIRYDENPIGGFAMQLWTILEGPVEALPLVCGQLLNSRQVENDPFTSGCFGLGEIRLV